MKKFLLLIFCSILIFGNMGMLSDAFDGPTHQYTTEYGLELVKDTFGENFVGFYNQNIKERLHIFCVKPDEDETEGAYKLHFYNPATNKNFRGEDKSALKMFIEHYDKAINNYKCRKEDKAYEELGRAIHFLEDLNTPVHTNNQCLIDSATNFAFHVSFENRCKVIQNSIKSKMKKNEYGYYIINNLEAIGKSSAEMANDNFYALYNKILPRDVVVANAIENAQKAVAGVLYKFYYQVHL